MRRSKLSVMLNAEVVSRQSRWTLNSSYPILPEDEELGGLKRGRSPVENTNPFV